MRFAAVTETLNFICFEHLFEPYMFCRGWRRMRMGSANGTPAPFGGKGPRNGPSTVPYSKLSTDFSSEEKTLRCIEWSSGGGAVCGGMRELG